MLEKGLAGRQRKRSSFRWELVIRQTKIGGMLMVLGKKLSVEAFLTSDAQIYGLLTHELDQHQILYRTETINSGSQNRMIGTLAGRIGERNKGNILYYIYTSKQDVPIVQELAQKILRERKL